MRLAIQIFTVVAFIFLKGESEKKEFRPPIAANLIQFANDYPLVGLYLNGNYSQINYDSLYNHLIQIDLSDSKNVELLLKDVYIRDQQPRDSLQRQIRNENETKITYFLKRMRIDDNINQRIVKYIFNSLDWPDTREFDSEAKDAIWYVLHHCKDRKTLLLSIEYIEKAFKDSIISTQSYAMLCDKISVTLGKKQIYGTYPSFDKNGNRIIVPEISISIDSINYQRHLIGLLPTESLAEDSEE